MGASPGRVVCRTQPPGGELDRLDQVRHPLTRDAGGGRLEHAEQAQQQINDQNGDDHAHNAVRPAHSLWPPSPSMRCTAPAARIDPTSPNASGVRQGTALRARPSAHLTAVLRERSGYRVTYGVQRGRLPKARFWQWTWVGSASDSSSKRRGWDWTRALRLLRTARKRRAQIGRCAGGAAVLAPAW